MNSLVGFGTIVLIACAALWALMRGRSSYYMIMASWASVGPMHALAGRGPRQIPPKDLIAGVRRHAKRLVQQAELFGLEGCSPAFERYVAACECADGPPPSSIELEEIIQEIKKRSREAKAANRARLSERLDDWRTEVSVWAQVVAMFVPKLSRTIASDRQAGIA